MKFCRKCQLDCSEEDVFCSNCGSKLAVSRPLPELADNSPREVLRFLVQRYLECVKSLSLLKELLSDYLANARAERFLLCAAAESGIPERLRKADRLNAALFSSLSDILTTQCFMQPEMAREGILIWAYALGLKVDDIPLYQPPSKLALSPFVSWLVNLFAKFQPLSERPSIPSVRKPGQVLTLNLPKGKTMELVWCPPGSFMMGSPESELGRYDDEAQHQVTLTKGFWIGKYAVTQEQYESVTGGNPSDFVGTGHPVELVSWDDAMAFCSGVQLPTDGSIPSGYKLTLPTEAQWEYACRAGTIGALNNGLELTSEVGACANLAQVGWYDKNSDGEAHEVGQKSPNAWGLYDMHGNVWEWCLDWYDDYSGAATDPTGPSTGSRRVIRGGSWSNFARYCRSAYRHDLTPSFRGRNAPSGRYSHLGLRPVLAPVQ